MKYFFSFLMIVIAFISGMAFSLSYYDYSELYEANKFKAEVLKAYDEYYDGTEELLDSIDRYDDWVDRFDNYKYYEGRDKVDSLYATQE